MSLKLNLIFCIIFALWTSKVSGDNIIVQDENWHSQLTGWRYGEASQSPEYKIDATALGDVSYADFDTDTAVVVEGRFFIDLRRRDEPRARIVLVPYPTEKDGTKVYSGGYSEDFTMLFKHHKGSITITLKVKPSGEVFLGKQISAGAWGSGTNSDVTAHIERLMIAI